MHTSAEVGVVFAVLGVFLLQQVRSCSGLSTCWDATATVMGSRPASSLAQLHTDDGLIVAGIEATVGQSRRHEGGAANRGLGQLAVAFGIVFHQSQQALVIEDQEP